MLKRTKAFYMLIENICSKYTIHLLFHFLSFMVVSMFMLKTTNRANLENKHLMPYNLRNDKKEDEKMKN